jgi:hypothetical protein
VSISAGKFVDQTLTVSFEEQNVHVDLHLQFVKFGPDSTARPYRALMIICMLTRDFKTQLQINLNASASVTTEKRFGVGLSFVFSEVERLRGTVREEGRLPLTQRLQKQHDPVHPCRF